MHERADESAVGTMNRPLRLCQNSIGSGEQDIRRHLSVLPTALSRLTLCVQARRKEKGYPSLSPSRIKFDKALRLCHLFVYCRFEVQVFQYTIAGFAIDDGYKECSWLLDTVGGKNP